MGIWHWQYKDNNTNNTAFELRSDKLSVSWSWSGMYISNFQKVKLAENAQSKQKTSKTLKNLKNNYFRQFQKDFQIRDGEHLFRIVTMFAESKLSSLPLSLV